MFHYVHVRTCTLHGLTFHLKEDSGLVTEVEYTIGIDI